MAQAQQTTESFGKKDNENKKDNSSLKDASSLKEVGSTLKDRAQDWVSDAKGKVEDQVSGAQEYFTEHSWNEIGKDVVTVFKKNPIPSLLLGVGIGIFLDRMMHRSHSEDYKGKRASA